MFDGTKLCFWPSHSSAIAENLKLPAHSELRQEPPHLLITVLKRIEKDSINMPTLPYRRQNLEMSSSRPSLSPAIARGIRVLQLSQEIRAALQQRYANDPTKRTYIISTVESFGFRHNQIDTHTPEEHAAKGVVHQEETLALVHTMNELGYKSKPNTDSASVVFIHNAAFDMSKHLLGLHERKQRPKVWFFAYGPFHALEPRLWGVREIFKRGIESLSPRHPTEYMVGGILTFTASSLMEHAMKIPRLLRCIDESATWIAFVSPLVIGLLQAAVIDDPHNQG